MAEYISMKQVPGGTVTSVDDRILYDINLTNGKIYGCEVSYLGNNMIHINAGYGVIKGGLFEIEDHTEYVDFAESEPTPGQIYLHFDAAAQDKLTIVKETSANAHQLVQNEDANYESGVYEIQICTFTATTTALTDVTETWPTASGAMETLGTMEEVMANTEAGKVADALVTKQLNSNLTTKLPTEIVGFSVGADEKPYISYKVGADTVTKKLGSADVYQLFDKLISSYAVYTENVGDRTAVGGDRYANRTSDEPALFVAVQMDSSARSWGMISNSPDCSFTMWGASNKLSFVFNGHTYYLYYLIYAMGGQAVYGRSTKTGGVDAILGSNIVSVTNNTVVINDKFFNLIMSLFDYYLYES